MIKIKICITEKLVDSIIDIGEQILLCGGEVHRAEESLKRMFSAYNAAKTDIFIITSSIVVTVHTEDGKVFTQTRRITETSSDHQRLHLINALSRNICEYKYSPEEISERYNEILKTKQFPLWVEFVMYSVIAGAFTLFFGGGVVEAVVSLAIGAFVRLVIFACDSKVKNKILTKFLSSMSATALAYLAFKLKIVPSVDNVIIGNIMSLIPGVGLTTALKDLLVGDSIAGTLRTIEAFIIALAIAAGYFAVAFFMGGGTI